jgi:hypothetical protein
MVTAYGHCQWRRKIGSIPGYLLIFACFCARLIPFNRCGLALVSGHDQVMSEPFPRAPIRTAAQQLTCSAAHLLSSSPAHLLLTCSPAAHLPPTGPTIAPSGHKNTAPRDRRGFRFRGAASALLYAGISCAASIILKRQTDNLLACFLHRLLFHRVQQTRLSHPWEESSTIGTLRTS